MTVEWLDSAYPPNDAQIAAAKAAGYGGWAGYFAGPNILNGWGKFDFDRVKAGGLRTMAYCSGWSDPGAMKAQGAAWAVTICLDDESAIRPTGGWEQGWLDASGAGQYGNYWLHGVTAAFHILAAYPTSGDPGNTDWWSSTPRPPGLTGWQWAGTHAFAGISVDSSWFDEGIAVLGSGGGGGSIGAVTGSDAELQVVHDALQFEAWGSVDTSPQSLADFMFAVRNGMSVASILAGWKANASGAAWQAELAKVNAPPPPPEPMLNVHYTFNPDHWLGDGPPPMYEPANETTTLANAVAFAKQFEAAHPGFTVLIDVAEITV